MDLLNYLTLLYSALFGIIALALFFSRQSLVAVTPIIRPFVTFGMVMFTLFTVIGIFIALTTLTWLPFFVIVTLILTGSFIWIFATYLLK